MAIKFNKHVAKPKLHSPLKNFEMDTQVIEHRADPLTGWTSVIRTGRQFWQAQYITDEKLIAEIASEVLVPSIRTRTPSRIYMRQRISSSR